MTTEAPGRTTGQAVPRAEHPPYANFDVRPDGCWHWRGTDTHYPSVRYGGRQMVAHRAYFAHYVAPIPAGLTVLHLCDNHRCVNPSHLALGTQVANMADMAQKRRRSPAGEEHAQARVTWDEVAAIRQRVADGETQAAVASDYNITQQRVSAIVRDVAWRSNGAQA